MSDTVMFENVLLNCSGNDKNEFPYLYLIISLTFVMKKAAFSG